MARIAVCVLFVIATTVGIHAAPGGYGNSAAYAGASASAFSSSVVEAGHPYGNGGLGPFGARYTSDNGARDNEYDGRPTHGSQGHVGGEKPDCSKCNQDDGQYRGEYYEEGTEEDYEGEEEADDCEHDDGQYHERYHTGKNSPYYTGEGANSDVASRQPLGVYKVGAGAYGEASVSTGGAPGYPDHSQGQPVGQGHTGQPTGTWTPDKPSWNPDQQNTQYPHGSGCTAGQPGCGQGGQPGIGYGPQQPNKQPGSPPYGGITTTTIRPSWSQDHTPTYSTGSWTQGKPNWNQDQPNTQYPQKGSGCTSGQPGCSQGGQPGYGPQQHPQSPSYGGVTTTTVRPTYGGYPNQPGSHPDTSNYQPGTYPSKGGNQGHPPYQGSPHQPGVKGVTQSPTKRPPPPFPGTNNYPGSPTSRPPPPFPGTSGFPTTRPPHGGATSSPGTQLDFSGNQHGQPGSGSQHPQNVNPCQGSTGGNCISNELQPPNNTPYNENSYPSKNNRPNQPHGNQPEVGCSPSNPSCNKKDGKSDSPIYFIQVGTQTPGYPGNSHTDKPGTYRPGNTQPTSGYPGTGVTSPTYGHPTGTTPTWSTSHSTQSTPFWSTHSQSTPSWSTHTQSTPSWSSHTQSTPSWSTQSKPSWSATTPTTPRTPSYNYDTTPSTWGTTRKNNNPFFGPHEQGTTVRPLIYPGAVGGQTYPGQLPHTPAAGSNVKGGPTYGNQPGQNVPGTNPDCQDGDSPTCTPNRGDPLGPVYKVTPEVSEQPGIISAPVGGGPNYAGAGNPFFGQPQPGSSQQPGYNPPLGNNNQPGYPKPSYGQPTTQGVNHNVRPIGKGNPFLDKTLNMAIPEHGYIGAEVGVSVNSVHTEKPIGKGNPFFNPPSEGDEDLSVTPLGGHPHQNPSVQPPNPWSPQPSAGAGSQNKPAGSWPHQPATGPNYGPGSNQGHGSPTDQQTGAWPQQPGTGLVAPSYGPGANQGHGIPNVDQQTGSWPNQSQHNHGPGEHPSTEDPCAKCAAKQGLPQPVTKLSPGAAITSAVQGQYNPNIQGSWSSSSSSASASVFA